MFGLTPAERRANILGAIALDCPPEQIAGKRLLLVEDIVTTGATVSECARVLKEAGAAEVSVVALAGAKN
jgi:predicted amidophosphoribosyltransferase